MSYIGSQSVNVATTLARPRDEFECSGNEKAFKLSQTVPEHLNQMFRLYLEILYKNQ